MLTPDMTFPASAETQDGRPATILAHHNDLFVGLIEGNHPVQWNPYGHYISIGMVGWSTSRHSLIDHPTKARSQWHQLSAFERVCCREIVKAHPTHPDLHRVLSSITGLPENLVSLIPQIIKEGY